MTDIKRMPTPELIGTVDGTLEIPHARLSRHEARPNRWTFLIPPIEELLQRYIPIGANGWIDPFAGMYSPAEFTNDLAEGAEAEWHMDALDFCREIGSMFGPYAGVIFDPPYSYRQVSDCYKSAGLRPRAIDTSYNFYTRVMNAICDYVKPGGYAISFGWNTNGFGFNRGYVPVEYMVVAHGMHHNDTLVVVERRIDVPSAPRKE